MHRDAWYSGVGVEQEVEEEHEEEQEEDMDTATAPAKEVWIPYFAARDDHIRTYERSLGKSCPSSSVCW